VLQRDLNERRAHCHCGNVVKEREPRDAVMNELFLVRYNVYSYCGLEHNIDTPQASLQVSCLNGLVAEGERARVAVARIWEAIVTLVVVELDCLVGYRNCNRLWCAILLRTGVEHYLHRWLGDITMI